jgi:hypothetical protein
MNATITIGIEDYQKMKNRIDTLECKLGAEKVAHEESRLGEPGSETRALSIALNDAIDIVRFAVANLHPMTVRGWPYKTLQALSEILPTLPGIDQSVKECCRGDWYLLITEMKKWEDARAEGREQELLAEENAARAPGPDHPIFGGAVD